VGFVVDKVALALSSSDAFVNSRSTDCSTLPSGAGIIDQILAQVLSDSVSPHSKVKKKKNDAQDRRTDQPQRISNISQMKYDIERNSGIITTGYEKN
jgi:hypothetical protein